MSTRLYRLGILSSRRRWVVVALWAFLVVGLLGSARIAGGDFTERFEVPGTESARAQELLEERLPERSGASARLVLHAPEGTLYEPDTRAALDAVLARVAALPDVTLVGHPLEGRAGAVAPGDAIAFADVRFSRPVGEVGREGLDALTEAVATDPGSPVRASLSGELPSFFQAPELGGAEMALKLAAALLIMLVAFGSVIATGLPLGLALGGLAAGAGIVRLLAAVLSVPASSMLLAVMLGLGVGIDYALFIVTRHRQQLQDGMEVEHSIGLALATAGKAVVFAGATVIISIGGLVVAGIPAATVMGASAAVVVAVMVAAAITLLPAMLGFAGTAIDRLRVPGVRVVVESGHDNFWGRWAQRVAARPWPYLVASVALLGLLATPLAGMRLAMPDASTAAEGSTRRVAHELLVEGFGPGFSGPLVVVIDHGTADDGAAESLRSAIAADPGVAQVSPPVGDAAGDTTVLQVTPRSGPNAVETEQLVHRLRGEISAAALADTDADAYVGGLTAVHIDLTDRARQRLPWFMATIIGLSLLLLAMVFRSVWVPVKAAAMNLLSIGAGYGAVVAVFQWGWGSALLGVHQPTPVVSLVPMLMFAILFGLSMDYEVFLLSRTREEYLLSGDNTASVVAGISTTARVITSAALIMIVVFMGFALGHNIIVQQIGLGLAVAVLVDATVVRAVLVPATMVLLGDRNWWLPEWVERRLPRFDIEGADV